MNGYSSFGELDIFPLVEMGNRIGIIRYESRDILRNNENCSKKYHCVKMPVAFKGKGLANQFYHIMKVRGSRVLQKANLHGILFGYVKDLQVFHVLFITESNLPIPQLYLVS